MFRDPFEKGGTARGILFTKIDKITDTSLFFVILSKKVALLKAYFSQTSAIIFTNRQKYKHIFIFRDPFEKGGMLKAYFSKST